MNSSNSSHPTPNTQPHLNPSAPIYVPPQRRGNPSLSSRLIPRSPSHRGQPFLTLEDLHIRYSPPGSPPLRMPRVQRSLSAEDLYQRFQSRTAFQERLATFIAWPHAPPTPQPADLAAAGFIHISKPNNPDLIKCTRCCIHLDSWEPTDNLVYEHISRSPHCLAALQAPYCLAALPAQQQVPLPPRDLDALRNRNRPPSPPAPVRQPLSQPIRLSPKLPDPPVFNGNRSRFEDWKLRVTNKLALNQDHFPTEAFRIEYVISRLGGEAIEHTLCRRRDAARNPYRTASDLLEQLSDVYETSLRLTASQDCHAYHMLKQGGQAFPEFYAKFIKYAGNQEGLTEKKMIEDIGVKISAQLHKALILGIPSEGWTSFSRLKDHLAQADFCGRLYTEMVAQEEAKQKAARFAEQYARAEAESWAKRPGKYAILTRHKKDRYWTEDDLDDFKR